MVNGTIDQKLISDTHQQIKELVDLFQEQKKEVTEITNRAKLNWVGEGKNEFETQYDMLISKVNDFGDSLVEIYDALVKADAEFQSVDEALKAEFKEATSGASQGNAGGGGGW